MFCSSQGSLSPTPGRRNRPRSASKSKRKASPDKHRRGRSPAHKPAVRRISRTACASSDIDASVRPVASVHLHPTLGLPAILRASERLCATKRSDAPALLPSPSSLLRDRRIACTSCASTPRRRSGTIRVARCSTTTAGRSAPPARRSGRAPACRTCGARGLGARAPRR